MAVAFSSRTEVCHAAAIGNIRGDKHLRSLKKKEILTK